MGVPSTRLVLPTSTTRLARSFRSRTRRWSTASIFRRSSWSRAESLGRAGAGCCSREGGLLFFRVFLVAIGLQRGRARKTGFSLRNPRGRTGSVQPGAPDTLTPALSRWRGRGGARVGSTGGVPLDAAEGGVGDLH